MKISLLKTYFLLFCLTGFIFSCVDNDFDEPPSGGNDPEISADQITSLEDVLAKWVPGDTARIGINKFLQGIVVADDKSGNFFRGIVIEDENSDKGIFILIDDVELFNTYPVGRRVFVKLDDLYIADFNGLPQIGATPFQNGNFLNLAGIQSEIAKNEVVLPGKVGNPVTPRIRKINELQQSDLNTLVMIEDVQFKAGSAGVTYAITEPTPSGVNHALADCVNNEMLVRTSGFSDFANEITPEGNGDIQGVYGVFGDDQQLLMRDLNDISFDAARCETPTITLASVREVFNQGGNAAPAGVVSGIVISDRNSGNVNSRNIFFEDESAGVLVRFDDNHDFNIGARLNIDVTGQELSEFRGLMQINNVPTGSVEIMGEGSLPDPQVVTTAQLVNDAKDYESEYIRVENATISGGTTFGGGRSVNDATGSIDMFTQTGATFANDNIPTGTVSVTGIASVFNTPQIVLNSSSDVTGGMSGGGGGGGGDGDLVTIASLRSAFSSGASTADEGFIQGVVISDRSANNINGRNIFIQDESAGIVVRFAEDHSYDLGDEIKVVVTGQEISEFRSLVQVNNVPLSNGSQVGSTSLPEPNMVTISELISGIDDIESTRVLLEGVTLSGNSTYEGSITVSDGQNTISMFTGSNATFAGTSLPSGDVDIIAIASRFNDPQIIINGTDDVSAEGSGGGGTGDNLSLISLRDAFSSGSTSAPSGKVKGVVISDFQSMNTTIRNLHLQDESGGITIRFEDNHSYGMGTELEINVSGLELSEFRGLLQVNNVPSANVLSAEAGTQPDPKVVSISELLSQFEALESTLVRLNDVTLSSDSGTYSSTVTVTDASGMVVTFIRSDATFSGTSLPTGSVDLIGIVTQFDDPQVTIRTLDDIIE